MAMGRLRLGSVAEPLDLFPAGYDESRLCFRAACAAALANHRGACGSVSTPSQVDADLTIDYLHLTGAGTRLLMVESGMHGPESYAGAAVQRLLLRDFTDRLLARGIDLLLIHALN